MYLTLNKKNPMLGKIEKKTLWVKLPNLVYITLNKQYTGNTVTKMTKKKKKKLTTDTKIVKHIHY